MRYLLYCFFLIGWYACGSESPRDDGEASGSAESAPATERAASLGPVPFGGRGICEFFAATAPEILSCAGKVSGEPDYRDNRTACQFVCQDPFGTLLVSVNWTADGSSPDVSARDGNPRLKRMEVEGADAAHLLEVQGRLMLAKGPYLVHVLRVPYDEGKTREAARKILEAL